MLYEYFKKKEVNMSKFYDVHCHMYNVDDLPMITFFIRYGSLFKTGLQDFKALKIDDRLRKFVKMGEKDHFDLLNDTITQIKNSTNSDHYEERIIIPLMMFFEGEEKEKSIIEQKSNLYEAINKYYENNDDNNNVKIYPFLGIDPTIANYNNIIDKCLSNTKEKIYGIKLYPPLNLDPQKIPDEFFDICIENNLPITVHCAPNGFSSRHIKPAKANLLTDPENWREKLNRLDSRNKKLRINFAHFGGKKAGWSNTIKNFITGYDKVQVYTDISYFILNLLGKDSTTFCNKIKNVMKEDFMRERILYGSDFYVCMPTLNGSNGEYTDYLDAVKKCFSGDKAGFEQIVSVNPEKFLFG